MVAEAPPPSLERLIDNLDGDNKDSLHLGKSLPRRNRSKRLLKHVEANPHVHLNYSTKMLQLGEAFSGSTQLSTEVNLVRFLKDLQQTSKKLPEIKVLRWPLIFSFSRRSKPSICQRTNYQQICSGV